MRSEKVKRADQAMELLEYIAAKKSDHVKSNDLIPIIATWFRQYSRLMQKAAEAARFNFVSKISSNETADLMACGRFSNSALRMMRTFLNKKGCNIFASERQVRKVEEFRAMSLEDEKN